MYFKIIAASLALLVTQGACAMETQPTLTDEELTALLKGVPSLPATTQEVKDHYNKLIKALNSPFDEAKKILSAETFPGGKWAPHFLGHFGKGAFDIVVITQVEVLFQQALYYVQTTLDKIDQNAIDLIEKTPLRETAIKNALPLMITQKIKEELEKTPLFENADDIHAEILVARDPKNKEHLLGQIASLKSLEQLNKGAGKMLPITPLFLAEVTNNREAQVALQRKGATREQSPLLNLLLEKYKQPLDTLKSYERIKV